MAVLIKCRNVESHPERSSRSRMSLPKPMVRSIDDVLVKSPVHTPNPLHRGEGAQKCVYSAGTRPTLLSWAKAEGDLGNYSKAI